MTGETVDTVTEQAVKKQKTFFGTQTSRYGIEEHVGISDSDRTMHTSVTGPTGQGKTNLLLWMALQDSHKTGFAFLNPKGGVIDRLMHRLPDRRLSDTTYINPGRESGPGINLLMPETTESMNTGEREHQQKIVVSSVMGMFRRLTDDWGERWPRHLRSLLSAHVALNVHEGEQNTLLDVYRCITNSDQLSRLIDRTPNSVTRGQLEDLKSLSHRDREPLKRRLSDFLENKTVRKAVVQPETKMSFREILSERKIVLVDVQAGQIGDWAAGIIGSAILTQLWSATAARGSIPGTSPLYHIFIDEIQEFVREANQIKRMLSQCREFNVSITAATQYLDDLDRTMEQALLNNTLTKIVFSPGASKDLSTFTTALNGLSKTDLSRLGKYRPAVQLPAEKTLPPATLIDTYPPWKIDQEKIGARKQTIEYQKAPSVDLGAGANAGGPMHEQLLVAARNRLEKVGLDVDLLHQGHGEEKPDGEVTYPDGTVANIEAEHSTLTKPGKVLKNLRRGLKQDREVLFVVEEGKAEKLESIVSDPVNRRGSDFRDENGSYTHYRSNGQDLVGVEELKQAEYRILELSGDDLQEQEEVKQECPELEHNERENLESFCLYREEDGFCTALGTRCVLNDD